MMNIRKNKVEMPIAIPELGPMKYGIITNQATVGVIEKFLFDNFPEYTDYVNGLKLMVEADQDRKGAIRDALEHLRGPSQYL